MEWILTCLADIRDWVPGHVVLYKRFKENGKLIEFCGRSNRAGLFVVIVVYFGGTKRGCIMIPASSNRAGWSLFQKELRNFCFGAKRYLWPKYHSIMVVEVVSLLVVARVGRLCLFMVISRRLGILKKLELNWGRT